MSDSDAIRLIRECSKDEQSYNRLLALFRQGDSPSSSASASRATEAEAVPGEQGPGYHQQLESELREQEALYRQVFENSALVKLLISPDQRIIDINRAGVAFYGYPHEQLLSGGLELISPGGTADFQRWLADVPDDRLVSLRGRHRLADGTLRDVDIYINRLQLRDEYLLHATVIDVTEGVQVQHALKESQRLIQRVTETLPDIVFVYDVSLRANIYSNRQLSLYLGYRHNPHIDIYSLPVYLFAQDRPLVTQSLQNLLNSLPDDNGNEAHHSIEIRALHHDSSVRWFSLQSSVFRRTPEGEVAQVIGILQDITHRKRTEEALESARWFIERVTSAIPDIVFVFNYDQWEYVYFNRSLGQALGYPIIDHTSPDNDFLSFIHDDDRIAFQQYSLRLWSAEDDRVYEFECRLQHHDGQWRYYHLRQMVFRRDDDGNVVEALGIAQDMTERKRTEDAVRANEARYRTLMQNLPDTIVMLFDHKLRYLLVEGEETLQALGYTKAQVEGMTLEELVPPHYVERLLPHYQSALRGEAVQLLHQVADLYFQTYFLPIFLPSGEVEAGMVVSRNVTRQKLAEEQALAYVAQQERLRLLSDFITMASHQFGTPLAIINSSTDLIRRIDDPERRAMYSHRIEEQVENIKRLVHKFMTMSRLDISDERHDDYFVLNDTVQNVVYSLPRAFQSRVRYAPPTDGVPMIFRGDPFQIQEALKEIIENALLYSSEAVSVSLRHSEDGQALIEVSDQGVGIQPAELPRIFDRFYRVDSAQTMIGFGLGLSIAQTIINRHAGRIEARSAPGSGSVFRVILPLVEG